MKKLLIAAVALSVFASAGVASAAPGPGPQGRYEQNRNDRDNNRYERRAENRFNAGRYSPPRGYQARTWRRGERLPASYRAANYRVDYRVYRLAAPPRGYHYVRVGNDVVLVADTSGVIASVIWQLFR